MLSFIKHVSKSSHPVISLVAVAGFGAALLGAFLGWILFPLAISFFVDKVYKYSIFKSFCIQSILDNFICFGMFLFNDNYQFNSKL